MAAVALAMCLSAGCAGPRAQVPLEPPAGIVIAFADGFHSGVVLARADAPPELLPPGDARPWFAFHFGERGFITGEAASDGDAVRLALVGGAGGMQVDGLDWWVHDRGGTDTTRVRVWAFLASAGDLQGIRGRLRAWVAQGSRPHELRQGTLWWPSARRWTLLDNCHDFTADILAGGGIVIARQPLMLAGAMRAALDCAWADRDGG